MHIEVRTDRNIEGTESLYEHVREVVERALLHLNGHITRVEVHISDENAAKGGVNDKRCVMEARIEGRAPQAVTHNADTVHQAVGGAAEKLKRMTETTVAKMRDPRG
jgi:hypothetical protein